MSGGPLTGLRLLELGTILAGPFATRLVADLGADVVKIEAPDRPDPMREWGHEYYKGHSLWWPVISRNKRLITLDLRAEAGRELFLELVRRSDAILENFRPGTLERWGLGWDVLEATNPRIVLVRISGYGQTGPYAERAGFAAVAEAMGGLRYINGHPGEMPPRAGISLGDSLASLFAVEGLLAALYERDALGDGRGQVVDVSILEACFALMESAAPEYDRLGLVRQPSGTRITGVAPSNVFRSRDGKLTVIAANSDALFRRLCTAMDRPELADDPRYSRHRPRFENQDELEAEIQRWAQEHTAEEIDAILGAAGVVCGPVYTIADIFADPHVQARDMLIEHEAPQVGRFVGPGLVPKFSRTPSALRWSGTATPGEHNEAVFGDLLGLGASELDALRRDGVV